MANFELSSALALARDGTLIVGDLIPDLRTDIFVKCAGWESVQCSVGGGKQEKISKVVIIGHRLLSSLIPLSAGIYPCWQAVGKPRGGISVNNNVSLICLSSSSHRWDGSQLFQNKMCSQRISILSKNMSLTNCCCCYFVGGCYISKKWTN